MAIVYLAHDLRHDRPVALKVMHPDLAQSLGADRFLREIRTAARLQHPHILSVIDSGQGDGFVWYVLPYVSGESLRARLRREPQLSVGETLRLGTQVAAALDYAHRHGVIHRDIKPENILLHEGEAMVADFGIALAAKEAGVERLTETGVLLGTPDYMSPEQASGDREPDARSDVYSLGAIVYEMLAGEPPHTGPTVRSVIAKLLTEPPTPLHTVRADVPREVESAVTKALAKVPADRFAGAAEFAAALNRPAAGPGTPSRRRVTTVAGIAALAAIALASLGVWQPWRRAAGPAPIRADVASVAVLPFQNLTGNPGDAYLSDGMTEEVIGQLAQIRGLKVISRTSTEALKGARLTLRQIADTLGVRHILEGSVRHAGDRIRVAVDLIDATTDAHVWASRYDRDLTDVFRVQEEIARHVADSLVSTVGVRPAMGHVARPENPAAYEAYLSGRSLMYRRTREGLLGAIEQFERAIAQDSTYAPAYAGLASVYFLWVIYNYTGKDFYEIYGRAVALTDRAVALDPELADGYAARGFSQLFAWSPADRIEPDFKRALDLRPSSANVHQWYAQLLSRERHHPQALAEMERAISLDPLAPGVRTGFSVVALAARRYDVAERESARAAAIEPSLVWALAQQGMGALMSGHPDRCIALSLGPFAGVRAMCLHALGRTREAAQLADSLRASITAGQGADSTFSPALAARGLAEYYAWIGDGKQSVAWLERAYEESPDGEDYRIIASGIYDKVRADPRFQAGLERARRKIYDRVQRERTRFALK